MLKEIYRCVDQYGAIQVLDDGAKRYLAFGNDHEQSCQIKASPHIPQHEYSRAIMLVLLFCRPQSVCVLGLGGGTSVMAFMHALPQCRVSAVELRPQVVKIAHHYFQLPKHPQLLIHEADAKDFLTQGSQGYDVLVADLYHHHGIDEFQLQIAFIEHCVRRINHGGWLVLNYWLDHELPDNLLSLLDHHFAQLFVCNSGGGNWIIYAGKTAAEGDFLAKTRVKPLAKTLGFSLNYYLKRLKILSSS
ncbi:MAG: fused MFS/spermidine synthase [Bermanella sp.]